LLPQLSPQLFLTIQSWFYVCPTIVTAWFGFVFKQFLYAKIRDNLR
jgi:hypothetical protein